MIKFKKIIIALLILSFLSCSVGPDFKKPNLDLPESYPSNNIANSENNPKTIWWKSFSDPILIQLIEIASADNLSIKVAIERVEQANANSLAALAAFLPEPILSAQYVTNQTASARFPGITNNGINFKIYTASANLSWELDLFGRLRRSYESSKSLKNQTLYNSIDAINVIQSQVATAYIQLRSAQTQKRIAEDNLKKQSNTLDIIEKKYLIGVIGKEDFERAKTQKHTTESRVYSYDTLIKNSINRLSVLIGKNPGELPSPILSSEALPKYSGPVTIAKPGSLIFRRPDLRAAEERAHAATAEIGANIAQLFPIVSFEGTIGRDARKISDLNSMAAESYNYGPRITWSILGISTILANIQSSKANAKAELLEYKNSVLLALEEVDNALASLNNLMFQSENLFIAHKASINAEEIAKAKYDVGSISFLDLLLAQESSLVAESSYIDSQTQTSLAYINLYKALGGAWEEETLEN